MKTFSLFQLCICSFVAIAVLVACDNNNETPQPSPVTSAGNCPLVLNQGNFYDHIASSIGMIDNSSQTFTDSLFFKANQILPGNTLQDGIAYGSNLYVIAYESNVLFVLDRHTLQLKRQLTVNAPRDIIADNGYVYISNYDGYVTRMDTLMNQSVVQLPVGPNPEEMTIANNTLYVTISDGMNYANNYNDGKQVAKINTTSFTIEKFIPVGINPTRIASDKYGNVFVISMGDYYTLPPMLTLITSDDDTTNIAPASMMAIKEDTLYAIYNETDWNTYQSHNTIFTVNTMTLNRNTREDMQCPQWPISIAADPKSDHLYITADANGTYGASYSTAGYVYVYNSAGILLYNCQAGVHPVQLVFR